MLFNNKRILIFFAVTIVCCLSVAMGVVAWSSFQSHAQYLQQRSRMVLISEALTRFTSDHGNFPVVVRPTLNDKPAVSWRVALAPYCQDISRQWDTRNPNGKLPQPPRGWPFTMTSSSMTDILAVIRPGDSWSSERSSETAHLDTLSPDEVIVISCDDIRVEWDSFDDLYWSGEELWIASHSNKRRIHNVHNCFVLRLNGVVEFYPGTSAASAIR